MFKILVAYKCNLYEPVKILMFEFAKFNGGASKEINSSYSFGSFFSFFFFSSFYLDIFFCLYKL